MGDDDGTEFYTNGDGDRGCPEGVQRESTITFIQGEEPELIEASEPSICNYEFVFQINCKAEPETTTTEQLHPTTTFRTIQNIFTFPGQETTTGGEASTH